MIRRILGDDAIDLDLPAREVDEPIDFSIPCGGRGGIAPAASTRP